MPGFTADPESINGSANLFAEIAAYLYEGRIYPELATLCGVADCCHRDVGAKVEEIAVFADDQYSDLVLLLIALATKLRQTGQEYLSVDARAQEELDKVLAEGHYVVPSSGEKRDGYLQKRD